MFKDFSTIAGKSLNAISSHLKLFFFRPLLCLAHSRKFPKFFLQFRPIDMRVGVKISTHISHPNIEAGISQNKCQGLAGQISHPISTGSNETVLKEENWTGRGRHGGVA